MGTRTQFVDDVTGEEIAAEGAQVVFAFQGTNYEIDLGEANREAIAADFGKWIECARIVRPEPLAGRRKSGSKAAAAPASTTGSKAAATSDENAMARAWFKSTGGEIGVRGRLPSHVLAGYRESVARGEMPADFLVSDAPAAAPAPAAEVPADDAPAAVVADGVSVPPAPVADPFGEYDGPAPADEQDGDVAEVPQPVQNLATARKAATARKRAAAAGK